MSASTKTARNPLTEARFNFQHVREFLNVGDQAIINCSHACSAMIMDDENLQAFIEGHKFHYYGGLFRALPAYIAAPAAGHWNIVLHMGGQPTAITFTFGFKKRPTAAPPSAA